VTAPPVEELIRRVSNWGRFGEDDELGTANLITPAKRLEAAHCIRSGESLSLAVDFEPDTPQFVASYRLNPQRSMVATGADVKTGRQAAYGIEGHGFADDMVVMSLQAATQWDALAHVFHDYRMYNGRDCALVGAQGAEANDIAVLRDRLVTRGVLADVAGHRGVEALEPDHHITVAELEETLTAQEAALGSGDALLVRTGHLGRIRREGTWDRFVENDEPGLGWDALPWLRERDVAAVAADNWAFEVVPSRYALPLPFHAIGIVYMGLLVGEIFELDSLAEACRARGSWDFLLSAPPLPFLGAVGSPVNPIAVL
jgi:kynurenine formamidase